MADTVYSPTTVTNPKSRWFLVPDENLDWKRFIIKITEVLLSVVAFAQEEAVHTCVSCEPLYFFEFVSCSAFLFTLLLLVLLSTVLHQRVGVTCWRPLDFGYTAVIFVLFFISSIVFSANNSGSSLEKSAVAFGFLASLVFAVDLVLFYWIHGLPCGSAPTPETSTNGPTTPEAEKLHENGA